MTTYSRSVRSKKYSSRNQVNLVSARSRSNIEVTRLSRRNSADGYARLRKTRARKKNILLGVGVTLASLLIATAVGLGIWTLILNNGFNTDPHGNVTSFTQGPYENIFVEPVHEEPFWVLLLGTDDRDGDPETDYARTDTIILVRVDQPNKRMAMISIPRDTLVNIPGYGMEKINAAYFYGEIDRDETGVSMAIKTVSEFAGIDIAYFVQVNFNGLVRIVNELGGVYVDVPVDIIGDEDAGDIDIYAGLQKLDGDAALVFCRSRDFYIGDYQRQANQRTFLQALAAQVLSSDLPTIASTISSISDITFTNMDIMKIIMIAQSMRGMEENAIHTYHVPSTTDDSTGTSYVIAFEYDWWEMITRIEAGDFPEPQDDSFAGVSPESYSANYNTAQNKATGPIKTGDYVVDVRNGNGIAGCARSVSDMLAIAGYIDGEIGNTNAYIYPTTLIIFNDTANRPVAEDILNRLGYGMVINGTGIYSFSGDILIVVGDDFRSSA